MKIALVILHADPKRGGAERYTADLATGLVARGNAVSVLAGSFGPEPTGGRPITLNARGWTKLGGYLRFLDSLDRHLNTETYDIIHAMLPVRQGDIYHPHAGIAAEAIVSGHTKYDRPLRRGLARLANQFNRKRRRFARVERELLLGKTKPLLLCLSNYIKTTVRRHYQLPEEHLIRLFNAVDLKKFDPTARPTAGNELRQRLGIGAKVVVALIIAQDFQRKGLTEAIAALKGHSGLMLVVVGKEDPGPYQQLSRNLQVDDRVIFAGTTTDPYAFYQAADFFVLPTRHDPCSLVVLESLAMGVPVISTIFNGACEIMSEGVHGFILNDASSVEALRECYRKMIDGDLRLPMRRACLNLRGELSQEHHLDRLMQIYRARQTTIG